MKLILEQKQLDLGQTDRKLTHVDLFGGTFRRRKWDTHEVENLMVVVVHSEKSKIECTYPLVLSLCRDKTAWAAVEQSKLILDDRDVKTTVFFYPKI